MIKKQTDINVSYDEWERLEYYEDKLTVDIVLAAANVLNVGADVVMEMFGTFFVHFLNKKGFSNLLRCQGDTLKEWLNSLNDLHRHLTRTMPDIVAPEFWALDDPSEPDATILRYRSARGSLLAPLVVGIVKEFCRYQFHMNIDMTRLSTQNDEESVKFTEWKITVLEELVDQCDSNGIGSCGNLSGKSRRSSLKDILVENSLDSKDDMGTYKWWHKDDTVTSAMGGCPFHEVFGGDSRIVSTPGTQGVEIGPSTKSQYNVDLKAEYVCKICPWHICIDREFDIIQIGDSMKDFFDFPIGTSVTDIFHISAPPTCPWDWDAIMQSKASTFELELVDNDHYISKGINVPAKFKGNLLVLDPTEDPSVVNFSCFFMTNPVVNGLSNLAELGLSLSDVNQYSMHRDFIMISEHHASETETSKNLEKLKVRLEREKELSNSLLEMMLPPKVVNDLRQGIAVPPEQFKSVSVFFSDIVGFTAIASSVEPIQVVDLLNRLYTVMDSVTTFFGLYKVETIGDAYMVVGGVPNFDPDHAVKVANFALIVAQAVQVVTSPLDGTPIKIRMGIHTGEAMAGIVGNMMPRYCLFGDTVNIASRMERYLTHLHFLVLELLIHYVDCYYFRTM